MCCASNTRCWQTVLYYLNGIGATWFPFADDQAAVVSDHAEALAQAASLDPATDGLRVEPLSAGDALAFFNFDGGGNMEPLALHAGLEVAATETKWVGSHFFRVPALCEGFAEKPADVNNILC